MARNSGKDTGITRWAAPVLRPWGFGRPSFGGFDEIRRDMDRIFNSFFGPTNEGETGQWAVAGPVDLYETADELRLRVELPGIEMSDLNITISGDVLSISGERKAEEQSDEGRYHYRQAWHGAFSQTIQLPVEVQADKAKATMKNGVLKVTLPKAESVKATTVKVEAE